jgi:uncharacterized protein YbjT (DUF2867 family)
MKIVIIGGTGLIGSRLVARLRTDGHGAVAASRRSGVNALTGAGLAAVLEGAQVVVDVSDSPAGDDAAILDFFRTSSRNLLAAEAAARVRHHVILSIVGADRLPECGYLRAKSAQEEVVKAGPVPYTILRAAQSFESISRIGEPSADRAAICLPAAVVQPAAADDVASALADVAVGSPLDDTVELAGPEAFRLDELARRVMPASEDVHPRCFGAELEHGSLTPGDDARIAPTRFEDWLRQSATTTVTERRAS